LGKLGGIKIIESKYLYKVYHKVRGLPASHKPNSNRPYYRKVKIVEPQMFFMRNENTIVAAPELMNKLKQQYGL